MPDTNDTTAPDAKDIKGTDNANANAPDLAAQIAALTATVSELTKAKADADQKAEEARKAALSEADKLKEERAAFQTEVANTKATLRREARNQAMDKIGILPNYRDFVPDVDPNDPAGAKALTDWAKAHPEAVKSAPTAQAPDYTPAPKSALGKILSGETTHPLFSKEHLLGLLNRN